MTESDRDIILNGEMLNDKHISFAGRLLLGQFPGTEGLISTVFQKKVPAKRIEKGVQIIHDRGNHWIVASTLNSAIDVIEIYDSVYNSLDGESKTIITNLFKLSSSPKFDLIRMQKQVGGQDCGLFAIAVVLSLLLHVNVTDIVFNQSQMRPHLLKCFSNNKFTMFPYNTIL